MNSKSKFFCTKCNSKFEADRTKEESVHPIYGACWKYVAACPDCNEICGEYKVKVAVNSSSGNDCCMENSCPPQKSGCCCCN